MNTRFHLFTGLAIALFAPQALAQTTLYYDTNGTTAGTSVTSSQNLTDAVWSTDPLGLLAPGAYVANDDLVFSAGTNGTGAQAIAVTGTQSVDGLTFNNGITTLTGGSSSTLNIGAGGIKVSSTDGATTLTGITSTSLAAAQQWNDNSTQALNENGALNLNGHALTFGGTGSGSVAIAGVISGNANLIDNSTTSTVYLNNTTNTFTGGISVNGGSLVAAHPNSLGNAANVVTLSNGGILSMNDSNGFNAWNRNITLGTGGGSVYAGSYGIGGIDLVYGGVVTGGTGLTMLGGDFITTTNTNSNVGTFNLNAGRALLGSGGIFSNNAVVNVASGAILDFGWTNYGGTLTNTINLASGSLLEYRGGSGMTFSNVVLPTSGTITMGSDDVGGGALTINDGVALTGTLTLDINQFKTSTTPVTISGKITGNSGLTIAPGPSGGGILKLTGANTYSGPTSVSGVTVWAGASGFGTSAVTVASSTIDLSGGTFSNAVTSSTGTSTFNVLSGSPNQAISGPITMSSTGGTMNFIDDTTSALTVGNIAFQTNATGDRVSAFDVNNATGSITFNGTYTSTTGTGGSATFNLGSPSGYGGGNYYVGANADFSNFQTTNYHGPSALDLLAGNLYLNNSSFITGQYLASTGSPDVNHTIYIGSGQNIKATLYDSMKNAGTKATDLISIYGQTYISTGAPGIGTWSGSILQDGTNVTLSAVAGSRLVVSGSLTGDTPVGLTVNTTGIVVISGANTFDERDGAGHLQPTSTIAAELKTGTTLIANTTGSAFGVASFGDAFYNNAGSHSLPVQIDSGAILGGSGISTVQILAAAAGSIIAPGDPGDPSLGITAKIQTLHLNGGLSAPNGLTMNFTLNGLSYDSVDFGGSFMSLDNVVTFNLLGTPVISAANNNGIYKILTGLNLANTNAATGDNLNFVINVPKGYKVVDFEPEAGPVNSVGQDYIEVQIGLAPEPSTYALIGLGLTALVAVGRFRRLKV